MLTQSIHIVTFLPFSKRLNMGSLIQSKNKYVVSFQLDYFYCTHNLVCHYLQHDDAVRICLFFILIIQLFARYLQRRSSNHDGSLHTQLHQRLTEMLMTLVLKAEGLHSRFLENSIATTCISAFSYLSVPHACCCWFIWKVFDVFVSVYLCIV